MNGWDRLLELFGSLQRDMVPSLVRVQEEDNLSLLQFTVLQVLDRNEDPTVKELARLIGRSESRTSRIVDQLVHRRFAERYEDGADRRARRVRVGPDGRVLLDRLRQTQIESQRQLWEYLSEDERRVFLESMELIAKAARRGRDEHRSA